MAIYRGPGGSGDAVNDSSSETRLAVEARDAALAAQAAAEAAQAAAETAETNAETAETNAETAETNAETAATNAASSASSASSSATNAASSASSASTSATNAASSASSASSSASAASTSASNAASSASSASSSASSASTSATNAANSASAASTSATNASNSATAAASSASSASSSASTATTQASNASTSATNAASSASSASSSASTATSQAATALVAAGNAATSATNAASSASVASTSATNASNSATAASSAQSAAEAARDAALSAYDNFDDRYLGPKASDPTLDNDGNALLSGALYFNTTTNVMKVYTGSAWVAAYVSAAGVLLVANNLSDLNNTATARTNLGLGTAATTAATDYATAAQGAKADTALQPAAIGVSVQGYDADTAKLDVSQSWSAAQSFNAGVTLGDASGDALTINSSAVSIPNGLNFDSNTLVIDATNNRVGVGTAVPSYPLDVSGNFRVATSTSNQTLINTGAYVSFLNTTNTSGFDIGLLGGASDAGAYIYQRANSFLAVATNNTERMRITSTGNVGIGTSSPSALLDVTASSSGANADLLVLRNSATPVVGAGVRSFFLHGTGNVSNSTATGGIQSFVTRTTPDFAGDLRFSTNSGNSFAERMRLDSSGNLGLGVTPSAWATYTALQIKNGSIANYSPTQDMRISSNAYYNAGWKRVAASYAVQYLLDGSVGSHIWYTAGTSTADSAITFTQAMTLNSSGKLLINTTTAAASLAGYVTIDTLGAAGLDIFRSSSTANYSGIRFRDTTNANTYGQIGWDSSGLRLDGVAGTMFFSTSGTERMRIGSAGQIGIGGANYGTSGQALVSNGSGSAPSWQTVSGGQYFGTATTKAIAYNSNTISENITVTAGNNGLSAGPVTVSTGYTVTVQTGANWVIV